MKPCWLSTTFVLGLAAVAAAQTGGASTATPPREVRLLVGDQSVFEPGFAVGDIAVADPKVADYRVRAGRRSLILLGIGSGRTRLILWHQDNKTRAEIELIVETRAEAEAESKLRVLLRDFPSVKVERVGSALVVSGTVSAQDDLALIERMAQSAKAESFVRYAAPERAAGRGAAAGPPAPIGAPSISAGPSPPPIPGGVQIEYRRAGVRGQHCLRHQLLRDGD